MGMKGFIIGKDSIFDDWWLTAFNSPPLPFPFCPTSRKDKYIWTLPPLVPVRSSKDAKLCSLWESSSRPYPPPLNRNKTLSHLPPPSQLCFTLDGT